MPPRRRPPVSHLLPQVQVTGRNGTAGHHHRGPAVTRHRIAAAAVAASIALLASGCMGGGDSASGDAAPPAATAPASVATPVAVAPATLGGAVRAGADTPKDVAAALKGDDVIVVAFLNGKAADDQKVAKAVSDARGRHRRERRHPLLRLHAGQEAVRRPRRRPRRGGHPLRRRRRPRPQPRQPVHRPDRRRHPPPGDLGRRRHGRRPPSAPRRSSKAATGETATQ